MTFIIIIISMKQALVILFFLTIRYHKNWTQIEQTSTTFSIIKKKKKLKQIFLFWLGKKTYAAGCTGRQPVVAQEEHWDAAAEWSISTVLYKRLVHLWKTSKLAIAPLHCCTDA